ncbi:DUF998 domain-containing protein [Ferruginibacter paludis]|uniref:DUF998 domain-containing protein n=1 Tax=Ferruginibacter paludis TaxID=1310417 RepID=UPI0025B2C66A|nr:DUF998 domain-containing protein [Ferruginibacter paludis]MDN3655341.1 DUF998 domain-containing protein [Ferruginibacter paludis]
MPVSQVFMQSAGSQTYIQKKITKLLLCCGILSSLLYVAMLIFVPMQYQGYSSVNQTISELSAIGAPTRSLWVPLGIIYTLLIAAFGWGVRKSAYENHRLRIAGNLLALYGIIGIAWVFVPMHRREVLAAGGGNISDTMHLVMGTVSNLFMMVSMGFAASALGIWFRLYTIATILSLFTFGILTGMSARDVNANRPTPWVGVYEIIMLGVFMLWVVVLAIIIWPKSGNISRSQ